jgi:hypothetical protein
MGSQQLTVVNRFGHSSQMTFMKGKSNIDSIDRLQDFGASPVLAKLRL